MLPVVQKGKLISRCGMDRISHKSTLAMNERQNPSPNHVMTQNNESFALYSLICATAVWRTVLSSPCVNPQLPSQVDLMCNTNAQIIKQEASGIPRQMKWTNMIVPGKCKMGYNNNQPKWASKKSTYRARCCQPTMLTQKEVHCWETIHSSLYQLRLLSN